jgi:hypothetical protein
MLYFIMPAGFHYIKKPNNIGLDISIRIFDAVADPRLSAQVYNDSRMICIKDFLNFILVGQIPFDEAVIVKVF